LFGEQKESTREHKIYTSYLDMMHACGHPQTRGSKTKAGIFMMQGGKKEGKGLSIIFNFKNDQEKTFHL
jgi:hypothetical protein